MPRPTRRVFLTLCSVAAVTGATSLPATAAPPSLLRLFGRAKPIEKADSFVLAEEDGPWLLMAYTCVGEDAQARAERIAIEIRSKLRLPAFIHKEDFNFTGSAGQDTATGARARYANPHRYEAFAVLVGEYDSVNHKSIEKDLERLKAADLDVFKDKKEIEAENNTTSPASMVKNFGEHLFKKTKGHGRNPMSGAFVTRNPLLPESFFQQPVVDSFVQQLNEDKDYSLLECDGKFTVVVRTFNACGTVVGAKNEEKFKPSAKRMDDYAVQANKMVRILRQQGEEAYQYHDRHRSVVTIGSFESLGQALPDGGFRYEPGIRRLMQQYSALNANHARRVPGRNGIAANHVAMIPYDVQPTPIAVPKASKRGLYSALR